MHFAKTRLGYIVIITALISGYTAGGCSDTYAGRPPDIEQITIGIKNGLLPAAIWIADEKGYFSDEGIDLSIEEFESGKSGFLTMLDDGSIDIAAVSPTPIMFSSFDRQDFLIFSTFAYSYNDVKIIARRDKGIRTATNLTGKKIGTPAGSAGQFVIDSFLVHHGISSGDVDLVDISPQELAGALNAADVDAIIIWEPYAYEAEKLLGENSISLPSSDIYRETINLTATAEYIQNNPASLSKILRAINRANDFIRTNEDESQAIVARKLNLDKETVTTLWNYFFFEISLDQSLLITLESEARWAIKNELTDKTSVPNYLDYIYLDAMEEVKPNSIGIMR